MNSDALHICVACVTQCLRGILCLATLIEQNFPLSPNLPAGISAKRPEISLRASAQREVESAIMLTLYPMSLKYSDNVIPT